MTQHPVNIVAIVIIIALGLITVVNAEGCTVLHIAAKNNMPRTLAFILEKSPYIYLAIPLNKL